MPMAKRYGSGPPSSNSFGIKKRVPYVVKALMKMHGCGNTLVEVERDIADLCGSPKARHDLGEAILITTDQWIAIVQFLSPNKYLRVYWNAYRR